MSPSSLRFAAALGVAAVLLSACGLNLKGPDQLNVNLVHSDITFGAPKPSPIPPPGLASAPLPPLPPPFFSYYNVDFSPSSLALCPTAGPGASPDRAATLKVTAPPAAGAYRFQLAGAYVAHFLAYAFKIPLLGSWTEYVRNVTVVPGTTTPPGNNYTQGYLFETVEPVPTGGYLDLHWQLRTTPIQASLSLAGTVHEPQGGLVLTEVDQLDRNFKHPQTIFHPAAAGLLVAPTPTEPGSTWTSVAADTTNPTTLSGAIVGKARVDACGRPIDGFEIQATVTQGPNQATLDYIVAPQYGLLIVSRKINGSFFGVEWSNAVIHRGQVDPSPLPAEFAS